MNEIVQGALFAVLGSGVIYDIYLSRKATSKKADSVDTCAFHMESFKRLHERIDGHEKQENKLAEAIAGLTTAITQMQVRCDERSRAQDRLNDRIQDEINK